MSDIFKTNAALSLTTPEPAGEPAAAKAVDTAAVPAFLCGLPLGEILKVTANLSEEKLQEALAIQAEKGGRIGEILVSQKVVTADDVARALGAQLDLPYLARIFPDEVDEDLLKQVPINFAKQARILPLGREDGTVALAVADPLDTAALDNARMLLGGDVSPSIALASTIIDAINGKIGRASCRERV